MTTLGGFCADPLWDEDLTLDGSWPQFTQCFQDVMLTLLPCGFLWLAAPFYTWYLAHSPVRASRNTFSKIFLLKLLFLCLIIVMWICDFLNHLSGRPLDVQHLLKADVLSSLLQTLTLIMVFGFTVAERRKRFVTSGVLFVFWTLENIAAIIPFYTYLEFEVYKSDMFSFTTFQIRFAFTLIQLFLYFFAEKPVTSVLAIKKPNPETEASFPSRLCYNWMNSLIISGYRQPLSELSMPDLNPREKSATVVSRFLDILMKSVTKAKEKFNMKRKRIKVIHSDDSSETSPLIQNSDQASRYTDDVLVTTETAQTTKMSHISLIGILFKTFWMEYLLSQIWKLFYDALFICNPLLLGALVDFVQDSSVQDWKGYALAVTLFVSTAIQNVFFQNTMHLSTSLGLRIRASIISAVFRKALTMDNNARKESTVGEVVNLMSVDADHISITMNYIWALWSSPLQIAVCLYLLYNDLGVAMFYGAGFLFLLLPLNGFLTMKLGQLETRVLALKDHRLKIMNEVLNGIKIIKLYAWESSFEKRVLEIRNKEVKLLRTTAFVNAMLMLCWTVAPFMVSLLTFVTYIYTSDKHYLDPKTAFVAISLFNIMRFAINFAPMIITDIIKAVISSRRLGHFLFHEDLDEGCVTRDENAVAPITITNGTFSWSPDMESTLKNINIQIDDGSIVAVVGTVGSGKSSLLSAMLGEITKLSGDVVTRGSISYVPQQAWIQNDSVRNNILFGKPYNESFYKRCIEACALKPDLDILPAGDLTEIGERGINLSGGQKQRVSLARAVYAQTDIYLLDDPLSAVDSHVGKHIFEQVISDSGLLAGKVRVLVTHGIHWLPETDYILVMLNGRVSESGHYDKLLSHKGAFAQFITTYLLQADEDEDLSGDEEYQKVKTLLLRKLSETEDDTQESEEILIPVKEFTRQISTRFEKSGVDKKKDDQSKEMKIQEDQGNLIEEEAVQIGSVKWQVIKAYAKCIGYFFLFLLVFFYIIYIGVDTGSLLWLTVWTDDTDLSNFTKFPANSSERMDSNDFYIGIYGAFGVSQTVAILAFSLIVSVRCVHASRTLHNNMLSNILHAPMAFFDTTPVGRIMNRFSKDLTDLDERLPITFIMWIDCVLLVLASLAVISYSTPFFIGFIVPMVVAYAFVQRFFIATTRQLKRLESKTKSPIFNHFSETLTGASVICAFGAQNEFISESEARVDAFQIFAFSNFSSNRWLGIRLEFVGSLAVFISTTIAVATRHSISGGIMGLVVSYALEITENLNWMVRMTSDLETQIVCVERIKEYSEIDGEAPWENPWNRISSSWPHSGHIRLEALCLRYREGLDLVLKNLNLEIQPTEKIGIVGRTGAGKSSLTLAMFRLVEPSSGRIVIDGVDIATLGLHELRSKVTILPQDPVIFAGSLRQNLDPFDDYNDEFLWEALQHAHLKEFVDSLPDKLDHECGEGGENLSVGQRQLLCLGRALLRKTKILILDEATAAVDMETDELIQDTIKVEFKDCTILTIAHRLNTVMDYDRILVLDKGEVNDFDKPQILLKKPDGLFHSLAKTAGIIS